ncbi:unnamed protein product [Enterobius vermicularis]|uniref:Guided entry of tail-anchored proteins factor 1 n=1 Tax=Enterobius vermicularis TaxID=51028 RepID=A0A0N4VJB7_ENTVE|nr:unnamed protein product [Enterobius vermicularis]
MTAGGSVVLEQSSLWDFSLLQVFTCCLASALFTNFIAVTNYISAKVSQFLHYKTPEDDEIEKVKKELQEGRQQLGSLSSTDQFAAYFKAERLVNRLNDQYQQLGVYRSLSFELALFHLLVLKRQKAAISSSLSVKLKCCVFIGFLCLISLLHSRSVIIGYISPDYFWPFSFLLSAPNILTPSSKEGAPVSLFSILSMSILVVQLYRDNQNVKKHLKKF